MSYLTYEGLLQSMLDKVPGNVDKREGSIIYDALAPCAYFLAQQNFQLENYINLVFADTAVGEYLDKAVAAFGMTRKEAVFATRGMITSGAVAVGTRWGINEIVYVVISSLSETEYEIKCETAGEVGNQYSGAMQPISNVSGIAAELTDIIVSGEDEESDDAFRARFYQKVRLPATSGNAYHYEQWALEVPGVGATKVFPLDSGPGTVTILVANSDKSVDQALEAVVAEYIELVRPIGASVTVDSPAVTAINIEADVLLDGTKNRDSVLSTFKESLNSYLNGLVFIDYRVSFAKVGSLLLNTEGVADYNNLKLNDTAANIIIAKKAIPVMGVVNISEVSVLGTD